MNKTKQKVFITRLIFLFVTIIGILMIFSGLKGYQVESNRLSNIVIISFMVNFIIILSQIIKTYRIGYSMNDMFWIFNLTFLFCAPFIQYTLSDFPWWNTDIFINQNLILYTNFIIIIFSGFYIFIYKYIKPTQNAGYIFKNSSFLSKLLVIIAILSALFVISNVGFHNLFARATAGISVESSSFSLILSKTVRMFPVIALGFHILYKKNIDKQHSNLLLFFLFILCIITNFPTALPRNAAAGIYLGIILIFTNKWKNKLLFKYVILFGLLFIFPLINIFRVNDFQSIANLTINLPNPTQEFLSGNFDAFSMLVRSIYYVSTTGVTWGFQLVGVALFFVPRFIWPSKPIGSGSFLGQEFGWEFTNVSMPYIGEAYINFGLIGIIIFVAILAIIIKKMDSSYIINKDNKINFISLAYPFLIGYLFFFLRGDMLSSFAFIFGSVIAPVLFLIIIDKIYTFFKGEE